MSEIVRQVGFSLVQDSSRFSDRVCNPCGRKIRNLGQLYHFVKNATTTTSTPVKTSKRNLDMPDKASPQWRKSKSVRVRSPIDRTLFREVPPVMRSKESLAFENAVNTSSTLLVQDGEMLSHMNVEELPNAGVNESVWKRDCENSRRFPNKNIGEDCCYQTMERVDECAFNARRN